VALFEAETATVSGNVFHDNTAPMGAGLGCKYGFNSVTGNVFYENIATQEGGGIYVFNASPDVRNNTMSENDALVGGGMYCDRDFDLCGKRSNHGAFSLTFR
jgi:parallel beta-helix repeat protein